MRDNPIAIAWELRRADGSATLVRRVMLISEYVVVGEMSRTSDVRFMEYHVSASLTEEAARIEAVRCTEMAEKQGYKMYLQPRWVTMQYDAATMTDYLTFKASLEDGRGSMAPIFDAIRVSGEMVGG